MLFRILKGTWNFPWINQKTPCINLCAILVNIKFSRLLLNFRPHHVSEDGPWTIMNSTMNGEGGAISCYYPMVERMDLISLESMIMSGHVGGVDI